VSVLPMGKALQSRYGGNGDSRDEVNDHPTSARPQRGVGCWEGKAAASGIERLQKAG
jgi:hypothetical protein